MIEAVYGDGAELVPQLLVAAEQKGLGKEGAAKTLGAMNVVALEDGYGLLRPVGVDEDIGTRLGEPTITLRLARRLDGKLVPWDCTPGAPLFVSWALSEVRVRRSFWGDSYTYSLRRTKLCTMRPVPTGRSGREETSSLRLRPTACCV